MTDFLRGLALLGLIPLVAGLLQFAWTLLRMPPSMRRELEARHERRKRDRMMVEILRGQRKR